MGVYKKVQTFLALVIGEESRITVATLTRSSSNCEAANMALAEQESRKVEDAAGALKHAFLGRPLGYSIFSLMALIGDPIY